MLENHRMTVLRVIDIETTGWAPPSEIVEVGRIDLVSSDAGWGLAHPYSCLYRPINGLNAETTAVHHITDSMVAAAPVCDAIQLSLALMHGMQPDVFVAHNCSFERTFIADDIIGQRPWICTHKAALRLWPDAAAHSNQVLRYWLNMDLPSEFAMPPHRAAPDAFVTANILWRMLQEANVEQLIAWTAEPKLLPRMPFGKHKNDKWSDIPTDYLSWMVRQQDMDSDVKWCAHQELQKR